MTDNPQLLQEIGAAIADLGCTLVRSSDNPSRRGRIVKIEMSANEKALLVDVTYGTTYDRLVLRKERIDYYRYNEKVGAYQVRQFKDSKKKSKVMFIFQ